MHMPVYMFYLVVTLNTKLISADQNTCNVYISEMLWQFVKGAENMFSQFASYSEQ